MHRLAISKMKIELPCRSVPPPIQLRMLVGTLRTRTSRDLEVMARRLIGARPPAAQHMLDAGIGMVGVVGGMRVVHGDDVGQARAASRSRCSRWRFSHPAGSRPGRSSARRRRCGPGRRRAPPAGTLRESRAAAARCDQARAVLHHFRLGLGGGAGCALDRADGQAGKRRQRGEQASDRTPWSVLHPPGTANGNLTWICRRGPPRCGHKSETGGAWRRRPRTRPMRDGRLIEIAGEIGGRGPERRRCSMRRGDEAIARHHHDPAVLALDGFDPAEARQVRSRHRPRTACRCGSRRRRGQHRSRAAASPRRRRLRLLLGASPSR